MKERQIFDYGVDRPRHSRIGARCLGLASIVSGGVLSVGGVLEQEKWYFVSSGVGVILGIILVLRPSTFDQKDKLPGPENSKGENLKSGKGDITR